LVDFVVGTIFEVLTLVVGTFVVVDDTFGVVDDTFGVVDDDDAEDGVSSLVSDSRKKI
jgi:hypothetical protein